MKSNGQKNYISAIFLTVLLIVTYKLIDNAHQIYNAFVSLLATLSPVYVAFGIAFLLLPICRKCEKLFKKSHFSFLSSHTRGFSVCIVYSGAALIFIAIIYILIPTLAASIAEFVSAADDMLTKIMIFLNKSKFIQTNTTEMYGYIQKFIKSSALARPSLYTSTIASFSKWLVNIVLSVIMSVYILLDRESLISNFKALANLFVTDKKQKLIKKYVGRAAYFIYRYFYCSILDAFIIFILSLLLMSILKIRYTPLLALVLGIFNLVPYFGSVCACIIAILVTFAASGISKAATLGICLLVLQQIDANVISPHLIKETLAVKPFWVLAGLFAGGGLFGLWGIILSVPFMAFVRTIVYDFIKER